MPVVAAIFNAMCMGLLPLRSANHTQTGVGVLVRMPRKGAGVFGGVGSMPALGRKVLNLFAHNGIEALSSLDAL